MRGLKTLSITFDTVFGLIGKTPDWTRSARQFRMSFATLDELNALGGVGPTSAVEHCFGHPVVIDNSVPYGTIHFEIPSPPLPKGLT